MSQVKYEVLDPRQIPAGLIEPYRPVIVTDWLSLAEEFRQWLQEEHPPIALEVRSPPGKGTRVRVLPEQKKGISNDEMNAARSWFQQRGLDLGPLLRDGVWHDYPLVPFTKGEG